MFPQFPSATSPQRLSVAAPVASNTKVPLKPGHSLMDWIRLTKSGVDLRGTGPRMLQISEEELKKHNKPDDAWMAIRGFVYNVSKYMSYHPGGVDELMKGAGKDATMLFDEIHRWVNFSSMLQACLVGKLMQDKPRTLQKKLRTSKPSFLAPPAAVSLPPFQSSSSRFSNDMFSDDSQVLASPSLPKLDEKLNFDWYQSENNIVIVMYTKRNSLTERDVVCDLNVDKPCVKGCIYLGDKVALLEIDLLNLVESCLSVNVSDNSGKLEIKLVKNIKGQQWSTLGKCSADHCKIIERKSMQLDYRMCKLTEKTVVTHDTVIYHFVLPETCHMIVPVGYHVYLQTDIDEINIFRPYTVIVPDITNQNAQLSICKQDLYLMIKTYPFGALTPVLSKMNVGDLISLSGYEGSFELSAIDPFSTVILLCAGTGFTPMIRILHNCLFKTEKKVKLCFYNKTEKDILWKSQLQTLEDTFSDRFEVDHVLSQPDENWEGKTGRITKQYLQNMFSKYDGSVFTCVCGTPSFTLLSVRFLKDLDVTPSHMHVFTD